MKKIRFSIALIAILISYLVVSANSYASTEVNVNYVYLEGSYQTGFNPIDAVVSGPPTIILPYATVEMLFDHSLSVEEKAVFESELRIHNVTDNLNLEHLSEVSPEITIGEANSSFYWKDNHILYYTPEGLEEGKEYTIIFPSSWTSIGGEDGFFTQEFTGTNMRTYSIIISNLDSWKHITKIASQQESASYVECGFKDSFNNESYGDTKIRIRGYFSAYQPKKSYTLKFDNNNLFKGFNDSSGVYQGDRKKIVFVAMGVSVEPSYETFVNNKLAYDLVRDIESRQDVYGAALAADSYFCCLTINGHFWGVYNITEHIDTGDGGWSTMKDRVEALGFDSEGGGMLHKIFWSGKNYPDFKHGVKPESEHKYRFAEEGNGTQTHFEEEIPYPFYVQYPTSYYLLDFDLEIKAKRVGGGSKMKIEPDLESVVPPYYDEFDLIGDGTGEIQRYSNMADIMVDFEEPVKNDKPVNAYFCSLFDYDQFYEVVSNDNSLMFEWLNLDSLLINIFFFRLANAWDNISHNLYQFANETNLEAYQDVTIPPAKYTHIIWDCDFTFKQPLEWLDPYEPPFSWELAQNSYDARQRYINLFYQETLPGGVLTEEYYIDKINDYLNQIGNALELEELRWDKIISTQQLLDFFAAQFSNPNFMTNYLLSLETNNYIAPTPALYYIATDGDDSNNGLSPETAFATIQCALDIVDDGGIIQVLPGTYYEAMTLPVYVNDCTLRGSPNNPSETIISKPKEWLPGEHAGLSIYSCEAESTHFTLDGFIMQDFDKPAISTETASGNPYARMVNLKNLVVQDISSDKSAIMLFSQGLIDDYSIQLKDVIVKNNFSGWATVLFSRVSDIDLDNVVVVDNKKNVTTEDGGGGIYIRNAKNSVSIKNSLIANNEGRSSNDFLETQSGLLVDLYSDAELTIINSTIAYNKSIAGSSLTQAPGLMIYQGSAKIINSIIWGNSYLHFPNEKRQIGMSIYGSLSIAHTNVYSGEQDVYLALGGSLDWLDGNIGEDEIFHDPLFIDIKDWENDGFSLSNNSPCAGTGIDTYEFLDGIILTAPDDDINGNPCPLPVGTESDMGAYEINQTVERHGR